MPLAAGTRIGPYEVIAPLGAGGMGEVFHAHDSRLQREAALKILPSALAAKPMAVERFRREAQLLAALSHPNIASVYGLEPGTEGAVLAMELVPGETLAERLRRGPLPLDEALGLALQIAEALEYAHERGIIHRDLKPANIKLTPQGQIKLLDFGLAKALAGELSDADVFDAPTLTGPATLAGAVVGTTAYMSPEQARGHIVDRRSDIWSFGAVLYEMLTAQRAFGGQNGSDTIAAVLRAEPDWNRLPEATPLALRQLLQRALRKDLRQRLQSIGDARIALEEIASGEPTGPAVAPPPRRQRLRWAAFSFALCIVAAAGLFVLPRPPQPVSMQFRALTSMAGVQRDPALSPDGRSVAFAFNRDGSYNIFVGVIGGGNLVQVTHGSAAKASPAWTPDGASLAYAQLNGSGLWDVWQVPALGGSPRLLAQNAMYPAWSPDGQQLAFVQASTGTLWLQQPGQKARQLVPTLSGIRDPRFSPNGRRLAFTQGPFGGGPYAALDVLELAGGRLHPLTQETAGLTRSPAWAPDGRSIYFASSHGGTFNLWKIPASGGAAQQITAGQGDDAQLDLSRDGKRLAFATFRTDSHIAELALNPPSGSTAPRLLASDPARNQAAPVYSPDGKRLVYFSFLKGVEPEQVWTSNADGSEATPLVVDRNHNVFPAWSPDGSQILFRSWVTERHGSAALTEIPHSGGDPRPLLAERPSFFACVGPQGSVIFEGTKTLERLDTASGGLRTLGPLPQPWTTTDFLCAPDGAAVAYITSARFNADPQQGIWVYDFHRPARQIFRGWVQSQNLSPGPHGQIHFLLGSPDLTGALWAVNWDGTGLRNLHAPVPALYDYYRYATNWISVAPSGAAVAFEHDDALEANLGLITLGK